MNVIHALLLTAAIGIGILIYSLAIVGLAEVVGRISER